MSQEKEGLPFHKENYYLLIAGSVLVVIGFVLMAGGKPEDPTVFNPEVFSARRITVAPILVLLGLATVMYGIFRKSKKA